MPVPFTHDAMKAFADATEAAGLTGDQVETLTRELHTRRHTVRRWPLWATVQLAWEDRRGLWTAVKAGVRTWRKATTP